MRRKGTQAALLAALCLCLCACSKTTVLPQSGSPPPAAAVTAQPLPARPEPGRRPDYEDVRVYFDGLLTDRGYLVGDTVYLSPETVCGFFGVELNTEEGPEILVSAQGLELRMAAGQEYMTANGRYLYTPYGCLMADGRVYIPADAIERVFGVQVQSMGDLQHVEIAGGGVTFIEGGENYYESAYPSEDLFWLSRIIYAEARNEPLAGLIGVGNVVLNRVESPDFPSTVYTVVFDREFTVQFEPISTGGVYDEPDESSLIAAYLALEGYSTVGDSLYFVNPAKGANPWFDEALVPVITIGQHHFYTSPAVG